MIKTEVQDTLGESRDAYCLLALLSEKTKRELSILLKKLEEDLGEAIWVMPLEALHITLCEIIQSKDYNTNKEELYAKHSDEYENITAKTLKGYEPIGVSFDTIEVSPQAIIVKGTDNGSFESIRKQLVNDLPLPEKTKLPPTIIHSTIARFRESVDVNNVKNIVKQNMIEVEEVVSEFKLIHLHVTPLLEYDTLRTYQLG